MAEPPDQSVADRPAKNQSEEVDRHQSPDPELTDTLNAQAQRQISAEKARAKLHQ